MHAAAASPLFAVPAASPAAGPALEGLPQVSLALLAVLAAIFALAWLMRRLRTLQGQDPRAIEIIAQVALGSRERAVLLRVAGSRVLVGLGGGVVNTLLVVGGDAAPQPGADDAVAARAGEAADRETVAAGAGKPVPPRFADLLRRSLGR
jgi:flagellar protein FliO/FliZ